MRFDRFEIHLVDMPLKSEWRSAAGGSGPQLTTLIVKSIAGEHVVWSESVPPAHAEASFARLARTLAPKVVGGELATARQLHALLARECDDSAAVNALDLAAWSLEAKLAGKPLHRHLGAERDATDVGEAFGLMPTPEALVAAVGGAVADGFRRVKLKLESESDVGGLTLVRERFPDLMLHIDCNAAFTYEDSPLFDELDRLKLAMIEQPFAPDDLASHARLRERIDTPVCLDESITSVQAAIEAIDAKACDWLHLKLARVGGLTAALEILALGESRGIQTCVGSALESAIGAEASLALALQDRVRFPAAIFSSQRHYASDLATEPTTLARGPAGFLQARALAQPGLSREPDPVLLKAWSREIAIVGGRLG